MMLGPAGVFKGKTQPDSIFDKSQKLPGQIVDAGKETGQEAIDKIKSLPNRFSKDDFMSALNHSAAPMGLLAAAGGIAGMLPGNSGLLRGAARGAGTAGGAVLGNQLAKLLSDKLGLSEGAGNIASLIGTGLGGYAGYKGTRRLTRTNPERIYDDVYNGENAMGKTAHVLGLAAGIFKIAAAKKPEANELLPDGFLNSLSDLVPSMSENSGARRAGVAETMARAIGMGDKDISYTIRNPVTSQILTAVPGAVLGGLLHVNPALGSTMGAFGGNALSNIYRKIKMDDIKNRFDTAETLKDFNAPEKRGLLKNIFLPLGGHHHRGLVDTYLNLSGKNSEISKDSIGEMLGNVGASFRQAGARVPNWLHPLAVVAETAGGVSSGINADNLLDKYK